MADRKRSIGGSVLSVLGFVGKVILTILLVLAFPLTLLIAIVVAMSGSELDPRWVSEAIQKLWSRHKSD